MLSDILGGALHLTPTIHPDERGSFTEWFKASDFEAATGFPFDLQQANVSYSRAGVLRGLHFADVPPGQAKFVICPAGRIFDVVADIRQGSPTFGRWRALELSGENREGVYIPVGFAHGFMALEESQVVYLTTSEYDPESEHALSAFDPTLDISWPTEESTLSTRDGGAPSLKDCALPLFEECRAAETALRNGWVVANEEAGL